MSGDYVEIHYRRPPDRLDVYRQRVVERTPDFVVTLLDSTELRRPLLIDGHPVLEAGSPVVWFTYPHAWYDIGRFHRADGTFTGYYANVLTPVEMNDSRWDTTDLALDVWLGTNGVVEILDVDEFERAVGEGWISESDAERARATAAELAAAARRGAWPPEHVRGWTLERARVCVRDVSTGTG